MTYILAERGHDVILVGRYEDQLDEVKKNVQSKYEKKATTNATDLLLPGLTTEFYKWVKVQGYNVDGLINIAGLGGSGDPSNKG